jgi:hypothetical protein
MLSIWWLPVAVAVVVSVAAVVVRVAHLQM